MGRIHFLKENVFVKNWQGGVATEAGIEMWWTGSFLYRMYIFLLKFLQDLNKIEKNKFFSKRVFTKRTFCAKISTVQNPVDSKVCYQFNKCSRSYQVAMAEITLFGKRWFSGYCCRWYSVSKIKRWIERSPKHDHLFS